MEKSWELYLGIDWGTFKTAIVYHLRRKDCLSHNVKAKATTVMWANSRDKHTSSQAAYDPVGQTLLYGYEVDRAVNDGRLLESDRIENIKVLLTNTEDKKEERSRLLKQLETLPPDCAYRDPNELIKRLSKTYYDHALAEVEESHPGRITKQNTVVRCAMGIPASRGRHEPSSKEVISPAERIRRIAIDAGLGFIEAIPEQEAAAIWMRYNEVNDSTGAWPHTGLPFVVLDGGGITNVSHYSHIF